VAQENSNMGVCRSDQKSKNVRQPDEEEKGNGGSLLTLGEFCSILCVGAKHKVAEVRTDG